MEFSRDSVFGEKHCTLVFLISSFLLTSLRCPLRVSIRVSFHILVVVRTWSFVRCRGSTSLVSRVRQEPFEGPVKRLHRVTMVIEETMVKGFKDEDRLSG